MTPPTPSAALAPAPTAVPSRRGPSIAATVVAVALSALCSVLLLWPQHGRALNWDEVDYVTAAQKGVLTNLWERGSLSIPAYIRFARAKISHRPPQLPAGYQEANDPFKLRHGHSPAVVTAMVPLADARSERPIRAVQLLGAVALTIALVVAYRLVTPTSTWAGLLVLLLVAPWYGWHMFQTVQFHGWSTVWLCLAVAFLVKWLANGRPRSWGLALCASLAALILTLESSAFVVFGVVVCLVIWVRGLGARPRVPWLRQYLIPGGLTVLAMAVAVWPGLVVKGGLLKLPAERFYQVFLGEGEVYHFNSSADLLSYLLPAVMAVAVLAYLWRYRRDDALRWAPLVVVAGIYLVSVVRFAVSDTYFLPAFAPVLLLVAVVAGEVSRRASTAVVALLLLAMVAGTVSVVRSNTKGERSDREVRADLAFVGQFLGPSPGLFDGGHVFRHYLPDQQIADVSYNSTGLLVRQAGKYEPVGPAGYQGRVVGMLATRHEFIDGAGGQELSARCKRVDRPTVVLWDCR